MACRLSAPLVFVDVQLWGRAWGEACCRWNMSGLQLNQLSLCRTTTQLTFTYTFFHMDTLMHTSVLDHKYVCSYVCFSNVIFRQIPKDQLNGVARFLEAKGHTQEALQVATDPDYRCVLFSSTVVCFLLACFLLACASYKCVDSPVFFFTRHERVSFGGRFVDGPSSTHPVLLRAALLPHAVLSGLSFRLLASLSVPALAASLHVSLTTFLGLPPCAWFDLAIQL